MKKIGENNETLKLTNRITVKEANNLSLGDVGERAEEHPVFFTPHVGNKWREDLISAGVSNVITSNFERNQSRKDILDMPEKLRHNSQIYSIIEDQREAKLTPYLQFRDPKTTDSIVKSFIQKFGALNPGHLHNESTRAALPNANLELTGESFFLGEDNELIRNLLFEIGKNHPEVLFNPKTGIFNRIVNSDGSMSPLGSIDMSKADEYLTDFFDWNQNLQDIIKNGSTIKTHPEVVIPNNAWMVLLLALKPLLVELNNSNKPLESFDSYCVSGPSMIKYATQKEFTNLLQSYYGLISDVLANKFSVITPANLNLLIVPGSTLDHLPIVGEDSYDSSMSFLAEYMDIAEEYKEEQKKLSNSPVKITGRNVPQKIRELKERASEALKRYIESRKDSPNISQYDVLTNNLKPASLDMNLLEKISFTEHKRISKLLEKLNRQK